MKYLIVLSVAVMAIAAPPKVDNDYIRENMKRSRSKIVGGSVAESGQFPFQVSIREILDNPLTHLCGGSIINEEYILTAGHCCAGQIGLLFRVVAGDVHTLLNEGTEEHRGINRIILHENYDSNTIQNDICLLHLNEPWTFDEAVNKIELPEQDDESEAGTMSTVTGFGLTSEGGFLLPEALHYVDVPVVNQTECANAYGAEGATVYDTMICAGVPEGGKDSCQGDSGGPMLEKETGVQNGIVSWGYGCAREGYPGVYTRVASYADWINENIGAC